MDIKHVIKNHGFTLEKIANELGITKGTLSTSINGNPKVDTLRKIASVIGCPVTEFFADEVSEGNSATCPHCGKRIKITLQ